MTAPVFVDTNVLVYCRDIADPVKQVRAQEWFQWLWREQAGRLSWQVLNEFYVNVTRKLTPGLTRQEARADVDDLLSWKPLSVDEALTHAAWLLEDAHSLSWWDALIVAAAQTAGCAYLLSEDMQAGHRFGDVEVIDPFALTPDELAVR